MKFLLVLFFLTQFTPASAEFRSASIGINGLTCSLCSNAVDRSLRKLDFVEDIQMDLNKHVAKVIFKQGGKVDIELLATKVFDAGYSVRFLKVAFYFNGLNAGENTNFLFQDNLYYFVETKEKQLDGEKEIIFIDEKYMSKKEFKKWQSRLNRISPPAVAIKVYFITV